MIYNASQWVSMGGALPGVLGPWQTGYSLWRLSCDVMRGLESGAQGPLTQPPRCSWFIDASHLKVHHDAQELQAIGYTRGGSNSKLHAMVDGKSRLVRAVLTAGQVSDMKIGPDRELVKGVGGMRIVADNGYDRKAIREAACRSGSFSCIPQRASGVEPVPFRKGYYRHRHYVDNFFQRIKRPQRIATRYNKIAELFLKFILLAASLDWINSF